MRPLLVGVAILALVATAGAQTPGKRFEVASVKPAGPFVPGTTRTSLAINGTYLQIHAYPLGALLNYIYTPQTGTLVVPEWTRDINLRFDIQAVLPAGCTKADVQAMLEALLVDRLGLKKHVEPRMIPAFDLMVAPGGTKMRPVGEANDLDAELKELKPEQFTVDTRTPDGESRTITSLNTGIRTINARSNYVLVPFPDASAPIKYVLDATRITMADFASVIMGRVERPVFDLTQLTGVYQFKIDVPVPPGMLRVARQVAQQTGRPVALDTVATINVPKQLETLGLTLAERKGPVDVIVIDSINRTPTEN